MRLAYATTPAHRCVPRELRPARLFPRFFIFGSATTLGQAGSPIICGFHHLTVARSSVHRILIRHGMNRLPANQKRKPTGRAGSATRSHSPGIAFNWT